MKIKDYQDAMEFFRTNDYQAADGAWSEFYQSQVQEPRIMDQASLGERPFNMAEGGQLVRPSVDGSRPGYRGGDRKLLDQLIEEANQGFKLVKMKDLQVQAGYNRSTNLMGNLDTLEIKMKKAFEHVMSDPNKLVTEMFDPMTQVKKLIGTNEAVSTRLKGWAPYEESKRLIKNLAVPLSKQRLSKLGGLTLGELDFRINNNVKAELLYSAPRKVTNETKIFDIVDRHIKQGGTELEWITKPGKTELGYPSYSEAKFKYKGKTYDMAELINNAETDPNFKEFFQAQKDYKKINNNIVKHPKTGKNIKFGDLMQEVYGYKRPYAVDHAGSILKEPFSNLRVLPNRINAAAGTISQYTDKFIVDPLKKGKYTEAGKASQLEKIGYNFNQSIDDLIKAEMNLANDVLVKGRVLRTPNQIVDSLRQGENYVPDFYSKKAVPGEGFAKQLSFSEKIRPKGSGVQLSSVGGVFDDVLKSKAFQKGWRGFRKVGGPWEAGFIGLDFINNLDNGMNANTAFQTALENATLGIYKGGQRAQWKDFETAGKELGHNPENLSEIKSIMDLEKMLAGEKEVLNKMIAYNAQEGTGVGLQGEFSQEEIEWRKDVVARLEKEFENKQNTFWSKDNAQDLVKNYQDTVGYIARKEYNKNLETGLLDKGRKDRVNPEMGSIGSALWETITDWKDYAPQSILPQNFLQNEITKAIPNTLRKLPGFLGDMWEPTSEAAKFFDMSEEDKAQRAKDLNIQEQYYHPVTGNTMTSGQMEPYYEKFYSEGGIASLIKK